MAYAITFDLKMNTLEEHNVSSGKAYGEIRNFLEENGYTWRQKSLYFGDDDTTPEKCFDVVKKLSKKFEWFSPCVKDIRMLRIEEENDLKPALSS